MFFTGSKGDLHNCAEEIYMLNYAVIRNSSRVRGGLKEYFHSLRKVISGRPAVTTNGGEGFGRQV